MKRNVVLIGIIAVFSGAMRAEDDSQYKLQQELVAVLKWEILWDDSPPGFQLPRDGKAQVSLLRDSDSLSYCSTRLGVCARYITDRNRNWMSQGGTEIEAGQTDRVAVREFASKAVAASLVNSTGSSLPQPTIVDGVVINMGSREVSQRTDSVAGSLPQRSTIVWEAVINLGSREDITREYRRMRPQGIGALEDWIRGTRTRNPDVKSITIACFAPSDPVVYYFVDRRRDKGSIEISAYWDKVREQWFVAASLERSQGPKTFERMRRKIESIACSKLN